MRRNPGLRHPACRTAVKPAEETRHDSAILNMRAAGAGKLGVILQRLHRRDRAWRGDRIDIRLGKRRVKLLRQAVGIKHHPCPAGIAGARIDEIGESRQRHDRRLIRQITFHHRCQTMLVTKQDQAILAMIQREQQGDRRVRQIGAANIHQPVHRIGAADHGGLAPRRVKTRRQCRQLVGHRLAGHAIRHPERARGSNGRTVLTP